jgi:zinc D-Ala-D-Ala carboxypeptidase
MKIDLNEHITPHFTWREMLRSEAAVRHGLSNMPESLDIYDNIRRVASVLEIIRAHFDRPVYVRSCFRSYVVNHAVGRARGSAHLHGLAADHVVEGVPNIDVCQAIPFIVSDFDQLIYEFGEAGWIHLGLSKEPRHELLTATKRQGRTLYEYGIRGVKKEAT